jgi:3-isopropylmalate dehydrogenase
MAAKSAFELARQRNGKKKVTVIHKNTVFKLGCGLFVDSCREVAREFPDITMETCVVDTFAMKLVMRPEDYDVVVATNVFGDILSDEAAGLVGGLGLAPGLNLGPEAVMANATHGSAPDIAGKNIANPFAMIMSAQLMFSWVANKRGDVSAIKAAEDMKRAAEAVLADKNAVTPDLGGKGTTRGMGEAILSLLEKPES